MVFALHNKVEPRKINAVDILEASIAKISKIAAGQNAGLAAAGKE